MSTFVTIRLPDGSCQTFHGREAWTLRHLLNAGRAGITTLEQPAPHWSHYIFKLRKAGLVISTDREMQAALIPAVMAGTASKPPSPWFWRMQHERNHSRLSHVSH